MLNDHLLEFFRFQEVKMFFYLIVFSDETHSFYLNRIIPHLDISQFSQTQGPKILLTFWELKPMSNPDTGSKDPTKYYLQFDFFFQMHPMYQTHSILRQWTSYEAIF